jgi:HD superfamily phosphohydrolase YqeK
MDRDTLNKWALTSENYHRKVNNLNLFGGLHDYLETLSNEQVVQYILKKAQDYPEIASAEKLNSLSSEYGITGKVENVRKMGGDGGLHDYIWRLPRKTLERYAFAAEKYHNKNQMIIGGLHDYIFNLNNQQIVQYIMGQVKEHPELGSGAKLDSLVAEYGLGDNESAPLLGSGQIMGGGLHDVVRSLDRSSLIAYALAMDNYSHEKQPRFGGIHDYVYQLEDNQIRNFILKQAQNYPELNNRIAVEGLIKKYNIKVTSN